MESALSVLLLCFHLSVDKPESVLWKQVSVSPLRFKLKAAHNVTGEITETADAKPGQQSQYETGQSEGDAQGQADVDKKITAASGDECCCRGREQDSNLDT